MRLRPSWTRACLEIIQATFFSVYGKKLYISENDLGKYLVENGFDSMESAAAHFKRAILYYHERYTIIPKFSHLTSPKIPALINLPDWEKALYATFPDFSPVLTAPSNHKLDAETHGHTGLFDSVDNIKLVLAFAKEIENLHCEQMPYVEQALMMLERLIFSMAYHKWGTRSDYMTAIAAQKTMARERLSRKGKAYNRGVHWSAVLVPDQVIDLFGVKLTFWEMPKVYVNRDFAARLLNISKYSNAHAQSVMRQMVEYAEGRASYMKFLITARQEYILTLDEREVWKEEAPNIFPEYPY